MSYRLKIKNVLAFITLFSSINVNAETTIINLNQQQLHEAQTELQYQSNKAISKLNEASQTLSKIKLTNQDIANSQTQINQSKAQLRNIKPLNIQLSNKEKYYLYSESVVNDNKQVLTQYQDKSLLDINQVIANYNQLGKNAKAQLTSNRLLIFISSSMPKKSIINLMSQTSPLGAVFIIRGLMNDSYVKTYQYFYKLKGSNSVEIMLNPKLFKAFEIITVPTFALYQSSQDLMQTACSITPTYSKVTGEVSVHYALEQLKLSHISDLAQVASNELDILDQSNFYERPNRD